MVKALLDTDTLSEVLKSRNANVARRAQEYQTLHSRFTVSVITVMEIVKGFHKVGREPQIARFLSGLGDMEVLAVVRDAAVVAGRIYADLERIGQPIGRADPIIAGVAIAEGVALVTGNTEHYTRIQALGYDLQLENWR